ncbi:tripartite ATP-independent transporter DctM subunit [Pseudarthrobacter siccitolerans]|uniref:Tripartite ATP-independent transporter DctM subunit n=1 Tax=Pseudarthrobacter siccitolerans TaxID=861266 RepID=A0ABU0PPP9_9MICC|nr:TRAP transporter large permease subunit [Pseudarthrobacter siccitolerans]MDQ0675214.1 tripartite ATP-independent transporter DctM subunit [Pseudarthrobacter siccitolerans]
MKHITTPEEIEEVIPSEAEEILHHGHVPPRWSGALWFDKALEGVVGAAIVAELVVILLNIMVRVITGDSVLWTQEVSEIALLTIAFIGGAIAYPKGAHMSVQALIMRLPAAWKPYLAALVDWLVLVMSAGTFALFVPTLLQQLEEKTPILQLPVFWVSLPFSIGMVLIAWFALLKLWRQERRPVLAAAGMTAVLFVLVLGVQPIFYYASPNALLAVVLAVLFILLFLGLPIAFVLALASGIYLYLGGISDVSAIPIGMASGAKGFVLLAIPFFILAGTVMNSAGLTLPLARLVDALIGHLRGGLLQVVVVTMYIFSGISGSKVADVAAVGTTMRGMLEERKYPRGEVVAVLSASAIMGETIPPSIVLLILGSITTISTTTLFLAGFLPAAFLALVVMALVFLRAKKQGGIASPKATWRARGAATFFAIPTLLLPVGMVVGILSGFATPTEVSSVAVAYAFILAAAYRRGSKRLLGDTLRETTTTAGMVLFIIAAASPLAQTLAVAGVSQQIHDLMSGLGDSPLLFMLFTILLLVIMGQLLEGLPAVLIFAPLLLPIAVDFGVNPVQYAMVLIISMGIGSFAPPAGVGFYVACATAHETVERSLKHFWPYLIAVFLGLLVLAAVPWFSTFLPAVAGLIPF